VQPADFVYIPALIVISILAFLTLDMLLMYFLPMPQKILAEPDERLRKSAFVGLVTNAGAMLHAIITFFWGLRIYYSDGLHYTGENLPESVWLLSLSLGYFLSDTVLSWVYGHNNLIMMMHHYVVILVEAYVIVKNEYASIAVYSLVLAEASNPFNIAWNVLQTVEVTPALSYASGFAFALVFIYCR
jgi:hypothetical protein